MNKPVVLATVLALAVGSAAHAAAPGYAEGIYQDYAAASSERVTFRLRTIEQGPLTELAGQPLSVFLGRPNHALTASNAGLQLEAVAISAAKADSGYLYDLDNSVDGFAEAGFPLEAGEYRLLAVKTKLGAETYRHVALEACWSAQSHCVVYDPAVEFLDSEVQNLRLAKAEGWTERVHAEPVDITTGAEGATAKAGRCGLASNPAYKSLARTWGSRTVTYKNLYGMTMVQKSIGGVQTGVRCDIYCRPQPFGYSNASSAWANIPFSVACDFASRGGTSGSSAKYVGKSGCSHRTLLGAKFDATAQGYGLSVDVTIDATGSIDMNGGAFQDRCAFF